MSKGVLIVFIIFLLLLLLPIKLLLDKKKSVPLGVVSLLLGLFMLYLAAYAWFESKSVLFTVAYLGVSALALGAAGKHFFWLKKGGEA